MDSAHVELLKLPPTPPSLHRTVPVGVAVVPASVSVTVARHVVGELTGIEASQPTLAPVERWVTAAKLNVLEPGG